VLFAEISWIVCCVSYFLYCILILHICFQRKSKGEELLDRVCEHLNLLEKDYFGLTYEDRHDPHSWLEMDKRIGKFIKSKFLIKFLFFFNREQVKMTCDLIYSLFIYIALKVYDTWSEN
jgi:hypothetical protein